MVYQFDINSADHLALVPDANVDPSNATQQQAEQAERDVVDLYTVPYDGVDYVFLAEYDRDGMDPTDADQQEFLDVAFLPAVAEQLGWLLLKRQANPLYSQHKLGDESFTYSDRVQINQTYPPNIERHLTRYDRRPVV